MKNKKTIKQNSYIKHYTNKLLLILATFFILLGVANAGTISDSTGVLTYDSVNVCMADGSVFQEKINNVYYVQTTDNLSYLIENSVQGDVFVLDTGSHEIDDTLKLSHEGINIIAKNYGGNKYSNDGSALITPSSSFPIGNNIINVTGANIKIEEIRIDGKNISGNGISVQRNGLILEDIYVVNNSLSGILIHENAGAENVLKNVYSGLNGKHGLEVLRGDLKVDGFVGYRNWNGAGIYIAQSNNQFSNTHNFYNQYSFYLDDASGNMITNNIFDQSEFSHIYISSDIDESSGNIISNNRFFTNSWKGGVGGSCTNNNTNIYLNDSSGNGISQTVIIGNTFDGCSDIIGSETSANNIDRVILFGNQYPPNAVSMGDNIEGDVKIIDTSKTYTSFLNFKFNDIKVGNGTNSQLMYFDTERDWSLGTSGSGGTTSLDFIDESGGKSIKIRGTNESSVIMTILTSITGGGSVTIGNVLNVLGSATFGLSDVANDYIFNLGSSGFFTIQRNSGQKVVTSTNTNENYIRSTAKPFDVGTTDAQKLSFQTSGTDRLIIESSSNVMRLTPTSTAPATCTLGDIYTDTSGAFCGCSATNTWENLGSTGSCT